MMLIIDASVLIAFYSQTELNEPDLFHQLANKGCSLLLPNAVYLEIMKGRKQTIDLLTKAMKKGIIKLNTEISDEETKSFGNRYPQLNSGDIQVILLGIKVKASGMPYYCLLSDNQARNVAQCYGLTLKGTRATISLLNQLNIIDNQKRESLLYRLNHC